MRALLFLLAVLSLGLAGACSSGADGKEKNQAPPLVKVEQPRTMRFVNRIEAVGTARANEQVTLAAPVTERILRLAFDDGSYIRKGQTVAVLAAGQESAQLAEAQARAREAEQQLGRIQALKNRGFATKSNLDAQSALAAQARAQAAGARAQIGDRVITAPFSGWVSLRNISAGAVVSAGTEIATISDISQIKLDFPVPETMLAALRPGLGIEARSAAYPDQPFRGQIDTIDPVLDPNSRAVMVRAVLPNTDRKLKPGMMLTVAIETAPRVAMSVPEIAVVGEGEARYVYVLGSDEKVRRAAIRTGLRQDGRIEVLEGLQPGARIVTEGVVKLSDGMEVRLAGAPAATAKAKPQGS